MIASTSSSVNSVIGLLMKIPAFAMRMSTRPNAAMARSNSVRPETARTLFDRAIAAFGRVDILIANAGIFISKPITEFTDDDVDAIIGTNLKGFFYPARAAVEH